MLGAIIGDIIGSTYEFHNTRDYNFELFPEGSSYTDDTICTIAIADAILKGIPYRESLIEWCRRYPCPKEHTERHSSDGLIHLILSLMIHSAMEPL